MHKKAILFSLDEKITQNQIKNILDIDFDEKQ
jgi:hypothetical protein